ncbi:heterokaryon incompatibility protein-domain-containing protein [Apiospora arundinis]|uniref:Heterokaryon incompatibility protein-domain-containing protein n=1 Tax=Apiospora arundinis TaxID=335852 RepID=A0ABR2HQ34_9PEZI
MSTTPTNTTLRGLQLYEYRSLPANAQTRIIELQPARSDDDPPAPLCCRLRDFDVYEDEEYEAISYTWGDPHFTEELVVDDAYSLRITPNLRDALQRFRLPGRVRRLWADAVCINQQDEREKSRQIPFIAQIYSGAAGVLVWLGHYPAQAEALRQVEKLARRLQKLPEWAMQREELARDLVTNFAQPLRAVFGLPWFTRLWVVQEVVLNFDVLFCCENVEVPWMRLVQVLRSLNGKSGLSWSVVLPSTMSELWSLRFFDRDVTPRFHTVRLLQDLSSAQCSDDRDKIWALSALATDLQIRSAGQDAPQESKTPILDVDYSMGATELYLTFAIRAMRTKSISRGLLLVYASIRSDGEPSARGLPSWAPDWRLPQLREPIITSGEEKDLHFLTCKYERRFKLSRPEWVKKNVALPFRCGPCAARQSNDLTVFLENMSYNVHAGWLGEPFPQTSTQFSIAAWISRTIRDLSPLLKDTGFDGESRRGGPLHPDARAVHVLRHVLAFAFRFNRDEQFGALRSWLERLLLKPNGLTPEMLRDMPQIHFPERNLMTNRRLFIFKQKPVDPTQNTGYLRKKKNRQQQESFFLGIGPNHMAGSDTTVLEPGFPTVAERKWVTPIPLTVDSNRLGCMAPGGLWTNYFDVGHQAHIHGTKTIAFRKLESCHKKCFRAKDRHMVVGDVIVFATHYAWNQSYMGAKDAIAYSSKEMYIG